MASSSIADTKKQIFMILTKKHSLKLKTEAIKYLESVVSSLPREELADALNYIAVSYIKQQDSGQQLVDQPTLAAVVESMFRKASLTNALESAAAAPDTSSAGTIDELSAYLEVVDAFAVPKWRYRSDGRMFVRCTEAPKLLAPAREKAAAYRDRFELVRERMLRNEAFRSSSFARRDDYLEIMPVKNLQGHKPGTYLLFGMLTQIVEGKYHLEDPDALIELELPADPTKNIARGTGLFTLNCLVLVEGVYTDDRTFRVRTLGMPLPEPRAKSVAASGVDVDFFGAGLKGDDLVIVEHVERSMDDAMFVIVSDVFLDQPRLRKLFAGFSDEGVVRPLAFVLIGSFVSTPYIFDGASAAAYKDCWNGLADLLSDYRDLAQTSHFIFVPGPNDPWNANILPRPGLSRFFTERLRNRCPRAVFASNPCRIKYCTQEIIVFREDLANRMRRNAIVAHLPEVPVEQHLVATILDQAHLSPLPISVRPTYWAYDHAMRVFPQPHLLVLADRYDAYAVDYEGCKAVNPGSFPNQEYGFMVYWPATRTCESSIVPAE
ncbi:DNA-directed DNA polymerase epsilon, subunit B [Geranomyces variabilis]|nr:DNA-directed DNA polymerase epsilon, subunit B [Geranomyces variabilis]